MNAIKLLGIIIIPLKLSLFTLIVGMLSVEVNAQSESTSSDSTVASDTTLLPRITKSGYEKLQLTEGTKLKALSI